MENWTLSNVADQTRRIAIITGANTGLGYEEALALASKRATTILACRNLQKGEDAKNRILEKHKDAKIEVREIDTSSFKSVRIFAKEFLKDHTRLDL